jgi:carboxylesterase type B
MIEGGDAAAMRRVAADFQDVLIGFTESGDPGTRLDVDWPPYVPPERTAVAVAERTTLLRDPVGERRMIWAEHRASRTMPTSNEGAG